MIHNIMNLPKLQMQAAASSGDNIPELRVNASGVARQVQKTYINDTQIFEETFPPARILGMDSKQLLYKWADTIMDPLETKLGAVPRTKNTTLRRTGNWREFTAVALQNMRDIVAMANTMFTHMEALNALDFARLLSVLKQDGFDLEMVGLIPKGFKVPFWENGLPKEESSVLALGLISREKLEDDSRGALRRKVEEQYGKQWTLQGKERGVFDVFALEGLVDAQSPSKHSIIALLSKIEFYAYKEQRIVVVPRRAYISSNGTDFTEYYLYLGFHKVEMEGRPHELFFTGTFAPSANQKQRSKRLAANQKIMVNMNLWSCM